MGNNTGGFKYEQRVVDTLVSTGLSGNITESAGASSTGSDADIVVNGKSYLVEVKQTSKAQMGGTSLAFDGAFRAIGDAVSAETEEELCSKMEFKRQSLQELLDFVGATSFPFCCKKEVWEEAREKGLLIPINSKIKSDAEFICNHYRNKGVHYIQIGGSGLFHMGENPANLPVPKLEGDINLEVRAGRSGSRKLKDGTKVVPVGLRVQGRLQFNPESAYTLDDEESIQKLVEVL